MVISEGLLLRMAEAPLGPVVGRGRQEAGRSACHPRPGWATSVGCAGGVETPDSGFPLLWHSGEGVAPSGPLLPLPGGLPARAPGQAGSLRMHPAHCRLQGEASHLWPLQEQGWEGTWLHLAGEEAEPGRGLAACWSPGLLLAAGTSLPGPRSRPSLPRRVSQRRRLLPAELSDVAFSKPQNEWKHILFGAFCYTPHQGWLQNQAWGSLLMLVTMAVVTVVGCHVFMFIARSVLGRGPGPAPSWASRVPQASRLCLPVRTLIVLSSSNPRRGLWGTESLRTLSEATQQRKQWHQGLGPG